MEDLKQYRVDFRVTYHCIGRKGLFRKKEYAFDFIIENDSSRQTYSYINSRSADHAIKKARAIATKHVNYLMEAVKKHSPLVITGNTFPTGQFAWSPKVYDITGVDIDFVNIRQLKVWKDEPVEETMKNLSMKQFKSVFGEVIPEQEEED